MKHHDQAEAGRRIRWICAVAIVCVAQFTTHGDYITDEYDRQWRELELSIADAPVTCPNRDGEMRISRFLREQNDTYDQQALILESDRDPLDVALRRTRALCDYLKARVEIDELDQQLQGLASQAAGIEPSNAAARKDLYGQVCAVRRKIAFSNPLLDFDKVLVGGDMTPGWHMTDIQWSNKGRYGNWLKVVDNPFSSSPTAGELLTDAVFQNGPRRGGSMAEFKGAFDHPCLSYDGQTVYFAWCQEKPPNEDGVVDGMWAGPVESESWGEGVAERNVFHIYKARLDGSNLTQLTFGTHNDNHPWQLPNGRVVFMSSRRPGNDKCVANKSHTMFSVKSDGTDLMPISWHETPEYYPSVDNDGMIMYTRWDYVDRGSATCHHLWTCYPDGRDPRAPHGNYMHPWIDRSIEEAYEYFDYSEPDYNGWDDGRVLGPYIEYCFRPIPGSHKIVCISGKHHPSGVGGNVGPLMIIDPRVEDDGITSQLRRITSYLHNEGEGPCKAPAEVKPDFSVPWPLSEDFYLTSWGNTLILLDRFGNREPLYTDNMRPNFPTPLRPRKKPPVIAPGTYQGERGEAHPDYERATISIQNMYITYPFWFPPEVVEQKKIKYMRIVQLFPRMNHTDPETGKTSRSANPMGFAGDANCRMSLGVVPVEEDGSVYCEAPVGKAIYFQALDENHMAIHSMRSITYVHPGEQLSCVGCHESKWEAPPPMEGTPIAFQRPPSPLSPELENGPEPMNYHRLVKPVFENTCIPCHVEKNTNGIKDSDYDSFRWKSFSYGVGVGHLAANGSRHAPGFFGASYTDIGKALVKSHRDRLTDDEWNSVVMWLDLNSMEFGSDFGMDKQRAGELVWPVVDVDPGNPTGVEIDQPRPDETKVSRIVPAAANGSRPELVVSDGRIRALSGSYDVPISEVRIVDVMGRTVMRQRVTGDNPGRAIETTGVTAGTYMLYVKTPNGSLSQRIVIARP